MGHDWKERFSEGRMIRRREPVRGYRIPLLQNLEVNTTPLILQGPH